MAVTVEGRENYKWTHGHFPRGSGHWAFKVGKETFFYNGTYSECAAKAKKKAKQLGEYHVKVMT